MAIQRIPIALRLFLTVVLTTLVILTASLGVLHWTMQKNFAKYVADVEMQKLDQLVGNLAQVYTLHHDWGNAIQSQILLIPGDAGPDDFDRVSRGWLRRQYDIALQQRYFKEHTFLNSANTMGDAMRDAMRVQRTLDPYTLALLERNLPSQFEPFDGLTFPLSSFRSLSLKEQQQQDPKSAKRNFMTIPDRLGLGNRLALFDAQKRFVVGEPSDQEVTFRAIEIEHEVVGYLGLKPVLDQDDALSINFFSNQKRFLFFIYSMSIGASLLAALWLATNFKKPIHRILKATKQLTKGNYQHQVLVNRNDELGDLANGINQLAEILHQHEQSRQQWVADTSHELKTPLAVLQAQIEAMQDGIRKATPEHLGAMMRQVASLKKLTQDLADLAQADAQQLKMYFMTVHPWAIVEQELENFKPKFEQAELHVRYEGQDVPLHLDGDRFKQVMVNLLSNSIRYTEKGGEIHVFTEQDEQSWSVIVDDSPLGLSDEQLAQLGERFYRVDDSRTRGTGGTGLGLALSVKITQALGGTLSFAHSPLGGLRCQVKFPKVISK